MYSIDEYVTDLRKGLLKRKISMDFIEEFLDNYIDQLETMKADMMDQTQGTQNEIDKLVLEQCESVEEVIEQVIRLYDKQEVKKKLIPFNTNDLSLILTLLLTFRIAIIVVLVSFSFQIFESWDLFNITWKYDYAAAIDIYTFSGIVYLILVSLVIDVILTKTIKIDDLEYLRLRVLLESSFIKVYYRIVVIICVVSVFAPHYIFHGPPSWYYRIQVFTAIILAVSAIEYFLKLQEIEVKPILTQIDPLVLFIGYYVTNYSLIPFLTWVDTTLPIDLLNMHRIYNYEIEFIFLITSLALLFLLLTNDYWRKEGKKEQWSRRNFLRPILLWIPLVGIFWIAQLQNSLSNELSFQTPYFVLFSFFSMLILITIPQIKTRITKLWLVFLYTNYSLILVANVNFQRILNAFIEEHGALGLEKYYTFLRDHNLLLLPAGIGISIIIILIFLKEKDVLKENSTETHIYMWTYRIYLFFLANEYGIVNLVILRLGYLTRFLIRPDARLEWIIDFVTLLIFIGLEVLVELVSYYNHGHEFGAVKAIKYVKNNVTREKWSE